MIQTTRRGALMGALAVPTAAGLAGLHWRQSRGQGPVVLHDPTLAAGRRLAARARIHGADIRPLDGDRYRLARDVLARRPETITGISRHADALLFEEEARDAGYVRSALIRAKGRSCAVENCGRGFESLGRMAREAGTEWVEMLADFAAGPAASRKSAMRLTARGAGDRAMVLGWVLTRR